MITLPQLGENVKLYGVGCLGCGSFEGSFEVVAVLDGSDLRLVLAAREVQCEGTVKRDWLSRLSVDWNFALQCWQAECNGHTAVVSISRHYRGPSRATDELSVA